jgi:hypothetical protein
MHGKLTPRSYEWNDTTLLTVRPQVHIGDLVNLIQQSYESASNYWFDEFEIVDVKRRTFVGQDLPDFQYVYSFTLVDTEGVIKEAGVRYEVNVNTVKAGIERILRDGGGVRNDLVAQVSSSIANQASIDPVWDIDDEACDVIIQLGVFGDVVFG